MGRSLAGYGDNARSLGERILIVDDEPDIRSLLDRYLTGEGFEVLAVANSTACKQLLEQQPVDLAIVDLGLGGGEDGLALTRWMRERFSFGIIILTGKNDALDRVIGLEMGADDYVGKPFLPRELLARMRSVLRRVPEGEPAAQHEQLCFRVDGITVDLQSRKVTGRQGRQVHLTSTEFELLATLMRGRNSPISRDQLLEGVFGRGWSPFDRSIDVHVANLRRKIEIDPKNPEIIKTVRGTGYVLVGPVEVMSQQLSA
jgi:two-component system, OmpR family, response regulator